MNNTESLLNAANQTLVEQGILKSKLPPSKKRGGGGGIFPNPPVSAPVMARPRQPVQPLQPYQPILKLEQPLPPRQVASPYLVPLQPSQPHQPYQPYQAPQQGELRNARKRRSIISDVPIDLDDEIVFNENEEDIDDEQDSLSAERITEEEVEFEDLDNLKLGDMAAAFRVISRKKPQMGEEEIPGSGQGYGGNAGSGRSSGAGSRKSYSQYGKKHLPDSDDAAAASSRISQEDGLNPDNGGYYASEREMESSGSGSGEEANEEMGGVTMSGSGSGNQEYEEGGSGGSSGLEQEKEELFEDDASKKPKIEKKPPAYGRRRKRGVAKKSKGKYDLVRSKALASRTMQGKGQYGDKSASTKYSAPGQGSGNEIKNSGGDSQSSGSGSGMGGSGYGSGDEAQLGSGTGDEAQLGSGTGDQEGGLEGSGVLSGSGQEIELQEDDAGQTQKKVSAYGMGKGSKSKDKDSEVLASRIIQAEEQYGDQDLPAGYHGSEQSYGSGSGADIPGNYEMSGSGRGSGEETSGSGGGFSGSGREEVGLLEDDSHQKQKAGQKAYGVGRRRKRRSVAKKGGGKNKGQRWESGAHWEESPKGQDYKASSKGHHSPASASAVKKATEEGSRAKSKDDTKEEEHKEEEKKKKRKKNEKGRVGDKDGNIKKAKSKAKSKEKGSKSKEVKGSTAEGVTLK